MAANDDAAARGPGGRAAHETRDVDIRRVSILAGVLALVIALVLWLMALLFNRLAAREVGRQAPPSTLVDQPAVRLPPEPRLQSDPRADLKGMRVEEEAALESYGWVDRERGVARIPVPRAMEMLVERGLPVRPEAERESSP